MNIFADRVKETTTTTGTGDITLAGAVSQFQSFDTALTNGDIISVAIVGQTGTEWEICIGTFVAPSTIQRTAVVASSNANAAVTFSAGTKDVFLTFSAGDVANVLNRANHTGTQSADTLTDGTTNKAFLATERTKLVGIATGATANLADAALLARANHTGTQDADTITDGTTNKAYTATEKTKLAGIATGATANSADATLLDRANHTGAQAISTVTGLQTALDDKASLAAANTFTANGALSAPAVRYSGSVITGGTGTTTHPYMLFSPTGATLPTTFNTAGTWVSFNSATGFTGNLLSVHVNGAASVLTISGSGIINATRLTDIAGTMGMWSSVFELGTGNSIAFSSTTGYTGAVDVAIKRNAAGVVEVNSGSAGTFRDIKARNVICDNTLQLKGFTVATLPAGTVGMRAYVTDATAPTYNGALTGGGAVTIPVFYNGSAWVSC